MRATYTVELRDVLLLQLHAMFRTKAALRVYLVFSALIFLFLASQQGFGGNVRLVMLGFVSLVGAAAGMLAGTILSMVTSFFTATQRSGVLGAHELTLSEEGVLEKTEANESLQRWPSVASVWCGSNYLLIQISAYLFHIVPRRTFQSEQSFDAFSKRAHELHSLNLTVR